MNQFDLTFKKFGNNALLIEWPDRIDELILDNIIFLQQIIEFSLNAFLLETINAYNSLTLIINPNTTTLGDMEQRVRALYRSKRNNSIPKKLWRLPVCYDEEFGIDLKEIAISKKISVDQIIELHCQPEYAVYFTGFLPGFLYLGGLPEVLHAPRKATPRLRITKGAVAIGGQQTGVYPSESPGGWNIIGNSPLQFFNPKHNPPCFAQAGDHLKFYKISKKEHEKIKEQVQRGFFKIEYETK